MTHLIQGLFVFLAMFATDICWATYIINVRDGKALPSAAWAVLLYATGVVGTVSIVGNLWMLVPASAGCFLGTYCAVKWRKK